MTRCQSLGSGLGNPMDSLQQVFCCLKSFPVFNDQLMYGYVYNLNVRKAFCTSLDFFLFPQDSAEELLAERDDMIRQLQETVE